MQDLETEDAENLQRAAALQQIAAVTASYTARRVRNAYADRAAEAMAALVSAFQQLAAAVARALQPLVDWINATVPKIAARVEVVIVRWRRRQLYATMRRRHVPRLFAVPLAHFWPKRWLPQLRI